MLRTVLAVLAFFALSQPVLAASRDFDIPKGQEKAYATYVVDLRKAMGPAFHSIKGAGGAEIVLEILAGGKFRIISVKASDEELEQRTRAAIAKVRLPRPPSWILPLRYTMNFSFRN